MSSWRAALGSALPPERTARHATATIAHATVAAPHAANTAAEPAASTANPKAAPAHAMPTSMPFCCKASAETRRSSATRAATMDKTHVIDPK